MTENSEKDGKGDDTVSDEKEEISPDELENVAIDGAIQANDGEAETGENDEEKSDEGGSGNEEVAQSSDQENDDMDNITQDSFADVDIEGGKNTDEETSTGNENDDDSKIETGNNNAGNTNGEDGEYSGEDIKSDEASANWSGNKGNETESVYNGGNDEDVDSHDIGVKSNGSTQLQPNNRPTGENKNTDRENNNSYTESREDKDNDNNNNGELRVDGRSDSKERTETGTRSEKLFGSDESELDTESETVDDQPDRPTSQADAKDNVDEDNRKEEKERTTVEVHNPIGINAPSDTINPEETTPPEGVTDGKINSPVRLVADSGVIVIQKVTAIIRGFIGVIKFVSRGISKILEFAGMMVLLYYGGMLTMGLIWPAQAGTLAGIGSQVGRLEVVVSLTISNIPVAIGLLFLAVMIDKIVNDGERFDSGYTFERL